MIAKLVYRWVHRPQKSQAVGVLESGRCATASEGGCNWRGGRLAGERSSGRPASPKFGGLVWMMNSKLAALESGCARQHALQSSNRCRNAPVDDIGSPRSSSGNGHVTRAFWGNPRYTAALVKSRR